MLPTKLKRKWFYDIQDKVTEYLDKTYKNNRCQWQTVTKDRVFEMYFVNTKDGELCVRLFMLSKHSLAFSEFEFIS